MGGFWSGKGKRRRRGKKAFTTSLPSLDSFQLFKKHKELKSDQGLEWNGIEIRINEDRVFFCSGLLASSCLNISSTPCNYGGVRYWFICPFCKSNSRRLYSYNHLFGCRCCFNLAYPSQNENLTDRVTRRQVAIMGEHTGLGVWDIKPKWMRVKTWEILRHVGKNYKNLQLLANLYSVRNLTTLAKLDKLIPWGGIIEAERILEMIYS